MSTLTFYWHDYETFGRDPRWARPSQFAGIRTDSELNIIGDPLVIYCQPPADVLPEPEACLITGITPQHCAEHGLLEYEFARAISAEMGQANTCNVGYNSIRFDDEFTRHLLFRNFYDPYEREWKNGNSRWDIIDLMRMTRALRPEGIEWPDYEGEEARPSFRLEHLTAANSIGHEAAHDALSDVTATIEIAKLVKARQPKLFDYALSLRDKRTTGKLFDLDSHKPLLHISSKFQWQHGYASLVMPLCQHPTNNNGIICYDLMVDPAPLLDCSAAEIERRVFSKAADLPEGTVRIPLKMIHLNRSPMVANLSVLDDAATQRLQLDVAQCERHWQQIGSQIDAVNAKVIEVMGRTFDNAVADPEFRLYDGFMGNDDKALCAQVRRADADELASTTWSFEDERLDELLFRYRARNFPTSLSEEEWHLWEEFRYLRLTEKICEDYLDLETFHSKIAQMQTQSERTEPEQQILAALADWGDQIL